jgi:hypothetical protein
LKLFQKIESDDNAVALFLKRPDGFLDIIGEPKGMEPEKGSHLVYLGKPMDFEDVLNATWDRQEKSN